jgi:sialate O-acetylesterase
VPTAPRHRHTERAALAFAFCLAILLPPLRAQIAEQPLELDALFRNHMVLQRDALVPIRGWTRPGARVQVEAGWPSARPVETRADADGRFFARLQTPSAGGPFEIVVRNLDAGDDAPAQRLRDVWCGDVWLLALDSERMPRGTDSPPLGAVSDPSRIRIFDVADTVAPAPLSDTAGSWELASGDALRHLDVAVRAFAIALHEARNVPIGIVTVRAPLRPVAAWIAPEGLTGLEPFAQDVQSVRQEIRAPGSFRAGAERAFVAWRDACRSMEPAGRTAWAAPDLDDGDWPVLPADAPLRAQPFADFDGFVWLRAHIGLDRMTLADAEAGLRLDLGRIPDLDAAWWNGALLPLPDDLASRDAARTLLLPRTLLRQGANTLALRLLDDAGQTGTDRRPKLLAPAAEPNGGEDAADRTVAIVRYWRARCSTPSAEFPERPSDRLPATNACVRHNGMIAPLAPFAWRGLVRFEVDPAAPLADERARGTPSGSLLARLVADWRRTFANELPFALVGPPAGNAAAADRTRELVTANREAAAPNAGADFVPLDDLAGDPLRAGLRLADWALDRCYGIPRDWRRRDPPDGGR